MELAGDRPRDQFSLFLDSEAFQSSIGRRDQCLRRYSFDVGCAKDRTERKRPPSRELRSAWRRWLCAAWWNTLLRRTECLFEPAPNATRSFRQKLDDQGGLTGFHYSQPRAGALTRRHRRLIETEMQRVNGSRRNYLSVPRYWQVARGTAPQAVRGGAEGSDGITSDDWKRNR
jgi:hypothetical protein